MKVHAHGFGPSVVLVIAVFCAAAFVTGAPSTARAAGPPATCVGNCNGDGVVAIDELILGVDIALGLQSGDACPAFENGEGMVDIAQLIKGVGNALSGSCVAPCGSNAAATCGGVCPLGGSCETVPTSNGACGCVSGPGGPCGGNVAAPPPVCAPGLVCRQALSDVTGFCEKPDCVPLFTAGCSETADCCQPCENGTHAPCGVCINGTCDGAP